MAYNIRCMKIYLLTALIVLSLFRSSDGSHEISKRETATLEKNDGLKNPLKNGGSGVEANEKDPKRKDREVELMDLGSTKKTYDNVEEEEEEEEEEEGFWSKVARVCLKLLKTFVRWLND